MAEEQEEAIIMKVIFKKKVQQEMLLPILRRMQNLFEDDIKEIQLLKRD